VPPYKPRLTIRTGKTNGTITIEIEDNGPGIPDEIKDKIMQPFFTTKRVLRERASGSVSPTTL
jgi:signal transduction histidine kinase